MKKIYPFFIALLIIAITLPVNMYAQCPAAGVQWPTTTQTPITSWQLLATDTWAGDYALFNVSTGVTYEWSFCAADGGMVTWDSELTLYNNANLVTALDYSDDVCGLDAKITWVSTFTGVARIKISEYPCLDNQINANLVYRSLGIVIPPVNDNCPGAITLPVNSSCVSTVADVSGATLSFAGCTGTANNDVWFQFTATSTSSVVSVTGSYDFDAVLEVFSGPCGNLTTISCTDTSLEGETEAVTLSNLIIGNTYYIRVYDWYSSFPATTTFDICVYTIPTCDIVGGGSTISEIEPCGLNQNGGCNTVPPAYQPIGCGNTIHGTSWSSLSSRDTDWYSFTLSGSTPVTLTGNAEFPFQIAIIDVADCANINVLEFQAGPQCSPVVVSTTLPAGSYAAFISHQEFIENPCSSPNNNYTLTLDYNTPATITPNGPTSFCAGGSVTLTANAGQSYLWSTGATTQSIIVTTSGTYGVTVTYAGGCTSVATPVTVTASAPATTITPSGATTFCAGGSVSLSASTGVSYAWSTGASTQAINVSTSGNYTVTVTYSGGCTSSASQSVTVNAAPAVSITPSGPTTFCTGESVNLTATAGSSYMWSNGNTSQTINVTTTGTYTVTVTDANGCTASASQSVTVNTTPPSSITPSGATTFCTGDNVTLTASAGTSYLWSTAATSQSINVSTSGTYTVTVTYPNGCTSSASQVVTVNTATPASITLSGPTTFCSGGSVDLTANSGSTYNWSNGGTSQTINVTVSGNYSVTVTYANGCTSSASQTVTVNTAPSTTISPSGPTTFCTGGSVSLTASSGTSYAWSEGSTTQAITVSTTGNYTVTVTYANGCTSSATQSVTVNPAPSTAITPSGATTFCSGNSVMLTATSGTGYAWSNGGTTQSITVSTSGLYTVTVTYANGCTGTASQSVTVNTAPATTISPSGPTTFCQGGNVTLTASAGTSYLWSGGQTTQDINVSNSGNYTVTVTYSNGCTSSAIQNVTVSPVPSTSITPSGPTTFCPGASVDLTATSGTSYLWSDGSITQTINVIATGNYMVTVTYSNGCTGTADMDVNVSSSPVTNITTSTGGTTVCAGESISLTATAGVSYMWSTGATTQSINVTTAGTYDVTVTYPGNCTGTSAPVNITVNTPAVATITPSGPIIFCEGGNVILTASSGQSYNWSNGETTQTLIVDTSGSFTVTVSDANGCTSSASTTVTVNSATAPTISASGSTTICQGDTVVLTSSSAQSYFWSGGVITQSVIVTSGGTYTVTITDANGCTNSASETVTVNPLPPTPVITASVPDLTSSASTGNQWYFNGNIIAGATSQNYTPVQNGDYTVIVTDANGCTAVSAAFDVNWVSISDIYGGAEISVYPNPVSDNLMIELININDAKADIFITNALGQMVKSELRNSSSETKWKINVSELQEGIYFVHLRFESKTIVSKFVVER
jgi:hypothetical protein